MQTRLSPEATAGTIIVPEIIAPFPDGVGRTIIDNRSDTHLLVDFARFLPDKKIATSDWLVQK